MEHQQNGGTSEMVAYNFVSAQTANAVEIKRIIQTL